jgi:hypothetical protein
MQMTEYIKQSVAPPEKNCCYYKANTDTDDLAIRVSIKHLLSNLFNTASHCP